MAVIDAGTQAKVTAAPSKGYRFDHWEGGASGTSPTVQVMMDSDKNLVAYFTKIFVLSGTALPGNGGSVSPNSGIYDAGTRVSLTAATSVFPYAFDHWSNTDGDSANLTSVTMDADKAVTAYFKQLGPGPQKTDNGQLSGPGKMASFELRAGQWVQGQIAGNPFDLNSQIVDSNNKVVKDLGRNLFGTFQFQAPNTGTYYFVISDIHSLLFNRYALTYSIYQ